MLIEIWILKLILTKKTTKKIILLFFVIGMLILIIKFNGIIFNAHFEKYYENIKM